MTQSEVSNRDWQQSREDPNSDMDESISTRSPLSLDGDETEPSVKEDCNKHGTPIHHPRFTSHREKLGNGGTNGMIVRPIPVHATLEQSDHHPLGRINDTSEPLQTDEDDESRPKRVLSSDQLSSILSFTTVAPAITGASPAKRIRFMSFDEILTTAKHSDSHYVSPSLALESVEEWDLQLGEELKSSILLDGEGMDHASSFKPRTSAPASPRISPVCVPLLTPPQSPRPSMEVVEWPSNLVVESALMSVATDARPLSPASLTGESETQMEETEVTRIEDQASTLTKRLSFITVGSN